jgi:hypothetical protein
MRYDIANGLRRHSSLLLLCVLAGAGGGVTPLRGQDPCDALVARAFNEFDASRRLDLLVSAVKPTACPPRGAWPVGIQLLAQTLIEDGKDSLAAAWLRWAIRLSPDLQPDTIQFLPRVVVAYRAARDFVLHTRAPADSAAATTWLWPAQAGGAPAGRLQITSSALSVPVQVQVKGVGPIGGGGSIPLNPGSYEISATASGYDSVRVTREVLPGVTTVLDFRLRSTAAQVAAKPAAAPTAPAPQQSVTPAPRKGKIPWWVKVGIGGGVAWAILWNAYIKSH